MVSVEMVETQDGTGDGHEGPQADSIRRACNMFQCPEEAGQIPLLVQLAISAQCAAMEASMAMPRVSEVGLEAALEATLKFSRGLRARMEARNAPA